MKKLRTGLWVIIAGIFATSGTIDLIDDNRDDLFPNHRIEQDITNDKDNPAPKPAVTKEGTNSNDDDEVYQALVKGVFGFLTIILGSFAETKFSKEGNDKVKFISSVGHKLVKSSEMAKEQKETMAMYLNNYAPEFKDMILCRLNPELRKTIEIDAIHFAVSEDFINTKMTSTVKINNQEDKYAILLGNELSKILEDLLTEKYDRYEKHADKNDLSLSQAMKEITKEQHDAAVKILKLNML